MTLRRYPHLPKAGFGHVWRLAGLRIHLYIPHPSILLIYFFYISWIYLMTKATTVSQIVISTNLEKSRDTKEELSVLQSPIKLLSNKSDYQTLP